MARSMLAAALVAVVLPGLAQAQDTRPGGPVTDAQFVMTASAMDLAEINLSRVAVDRATDPAVKKFAQHMLDDHMKSSTRLLGLANKKTLTPARTMDAKHQALAQRLIPLRGADFDRTFMTQMVEDHKAAVALFEAEAKTAKDADLKAFAAKTLPTLQEHLKMAQDVAGKLKGGTGTGAKDKGTDRR